MSDENFTKYLNKNYSEKIERMSTDDVAEFQEAFSLFDNRGDGKIDLKQLGNVLRALGQNPTEAEIAKCTEGMEENSRITFDTFLPILQSVNKTPSSISVEEFIEGLRCFDRDGNGTINSADLRHILTTLGEPLTSDEVEQIIEGEEDEQGNVNYDEFVRKVMCG